MSLDPQDRFPGMKALTKAPSLGGELGVGLSLVGRRDYDPETDTFVATHCFTVLFVPVLALGAYRVAQQQGRWYFLGRVPLSPFAFRWNVFLLVALLLCGGAGGWTIYQRQPGPAARRQIAEADRLAAGGEQGQAAARYHAVIRTAPSAEAEAARGKLRDLVAAPPADARQAAALFRVAVEAHREGRLVLPDLFERGAKAAAAVSQADPAGALEIIEVIAPFAPSPRDHLAPRRAYLERLVASQPADVGLASRLAVVYEGLGERERCEKLLAPHAKSLGEREGAAILGRLYASQGKPDRAFALLEPFVSARLPRLHAAEKDYRASIDTVQKLALDELRRGNAPGFDYDKYKAAGNDEQGRMVGAFVQARMKDNVAITSALDTLRAQRAVVPATLDLGIVRLQLARAVPDPAKRRAALEAAEKTFLSVRNLAGETPEYRLFLGQVYYWLGKHAEGRKLFDKLLDDQKRAAPMLLSITRVLREVGAITEARKLAEEAYETAADARVKHEAAHFRGVMYKDVDDQITWLERSDTSSPDVKATLAAARGQKASAEGKDKEAEGHYRQSVALYAKMPENSATLNNAALAHFALYRVTFEAEQFTRGLDKLERALALEPGDSILLNNAAGLVLEAALRDVIGRRIDLAALKQSASMSLLSFLYADERGRAEVAAAVAKHPGTIKARAYLEKELLLAPKRPEAYGTLARLFNLTGDVKGLEDVGERLGGVELDLEEANRRTRDYYAGKDEPKRVEELKTGIEQMEGRLPAARKKGGRTFAVAAAGLASARAGAAELLTVSDPGALVRLAEEAHRASPSDGTRNALAAALSLRAHRALIQAEPAYAALAKESRRGLGAGLISWVLAGEEGELRDRVAANADVKRVAAIRQEQLKHLPDRTGPNTWALLRATHPAEAAKLVKALQKDRRAELKRRIDAALSPLSPWPVLEEAWLLRAAGKAEQAKEALKRAAKAGVPLPQ